MFMHSKKRAGKDVGVGSVQSVCVCKGVAAHLQLGFKFIYLYVQIPISYREGQNLQKGQLEGRTRARGRQERGRQVRAINQVY
jgi:hypothetical protein